MKRIELENGCYKEIYYYDSGETKISNELYMLNGKYHRLNGPAVIWYFKTVEIDKEYYCINGKIHRLDGPAGICYYKSGEIEDEYYWINDIKYSKEEFNKKINIKRNLKLLNKK